MTDLGEWVDKPEVIVLGAGVIGLTAALKIQEQDDYKVTIIAETLPSDPKSIQYASHWAGAHHVSFARDDPRQEQMDQETFDMMWSLSEPGGAAEKCFLRLSQTECYPAEMPGRHELENMPNFEWMKKEELPQGAVSGVRFTTVTIDTPLYLNWLCARFLAAGGSLIRGTVQHISQIAEGGARVYTSSHKAAQPPAAVVVCVGLAARTLGGVEDKDVYPVSGQTIRLRAPWIRDGQTLSTEAGLRTYTIPRKSGDLIVGGTKGVNDWYPNPRPDVTRQILSRVLELVPEIVPPRLRANPNGPPQVEDALPLVIDEGCGLRPARHGGIRLAVDWVSAGPESTTTKKVPVIYNYGHGGYGFQSSWGSANIALELLKGALKDGETAKDVLNRVAQGELHGKFPTKS